MRPLTDKSRLQGFSLPEIKKGLDLMATELSGEHSLNGRILKPSHVINALVLNFLRRMTTDEQTEVLNWGLAELERLQALEEPEPIRGTVDLKRAKKKKPNDG